MDTNSGDLLRVILENELSNNINSHHINSVNTFYSTGINQIATDTFQINVEVLNERDTTENDKEIEKILGRNRINEKKYISRKIDIDILLIEDLIIDSEELTIPHVEMCNRKFVLDPLIEIDPNLIHPIKKISLREIYNAFEQNQLVKKTNLSLNNPSNLLSIGKYNYIAIEGNIGSGKTSLSKQISADFNTKLMLERFIDNPFLPKFYENPRDFAFKLEMSFLADRYQQTNEDLSQLNFFNKNIISDYDIHKSLIFSKINLNSDEFNLYRKLFYSLYKILKLYIVIYV